MIDFNCPGCGHRFSTDQKHVGKRAKCGRCGQAVEVPSESEPETIQAAPLAVAERSVTPTAARVAPSSPSRTLSSILADAFKHSHEPAHRLLDDLPARGRRR